MNTKQTSELAKALRFIEKARVCFERVKYPNSGVLLDRSITRDEHTAIDESDMLLTVAIRRINQIGVV